MASLVFTAIDSNGCRIVCTEECWKFHILEGHSDLEGQEEFVKRAIEHPSIPGIYQDKDYPERRIYYSLDDSREYYLRVVVRLLDDHNGEVITAFWADSIRPGDKLIWPTS